LEKYYETSRIEKSYKSKIKTCARVRN